MLNKFLKSNLKGSFMSRPSRFPGSAMIRKPQPHGYGMNFELLENGLVYCKFTFDTTKEGPPGFAHGGAVASVLDEAMGTACFEAQRMGFTVTMTVNYRLSSPIDQELEVFGKVDNIEKSKTFASAELKSLDGKVLADSTGIFIISDRLKQLIRDRYEANGKTLPEYSTNKDDKTDYSPIDE
jgi:acyl-coenzyme A thioesterase PaaI-like protein